MEHRSRSGNGWIYGYLENHTPVLVVSDADIFQDVFIEKFLNFNSRCCFPLETHKGKTLHVFSALGLHWKRQRMFSIPPFPEQYRKGQAFDINDPYLRYSQKISALSAISGLLVVLLLLITELDQLWRFIFHLNSNIQHWL